MIHPQDLRNVGRDLISFLHNSSIFTYKEQFNSLVKDDSVHNTLVCLNRIVPTDLNYGWCNDRYLFYMLTINLIKDFVKPKRVLYGLEHQKSKENNIYDYFEVRMCSTFGKVDYTKHKISMLELWKDHPYNTIFDMTIHESGSYLIAYFYGKRQIDKKYYLNYFTKKLKNEKE